MGVSTADKRAAFRQLHAAGCFVMPNPWDVGSARALAHLGFKAVASTSAGFAWTIGQRDSAVPLDTMLAHLSALSAAVDLPVNADFEGGYAVEPEGVARNVIRAAATGISGLSIEDSTHDPEKPLFDMNLAVERIAAARRALDSDKAGANVILTARSEGYIVGRPDLQETIRRLTAFAAAGADCLYAPGIRTEQDIAAIVAAVAPKPVNLLIGRAGLDVATAGRLGVRRISVGGALARTAWGEFMRAAQEIAGAGTFTALDRGAATAAVEQAIDPSAKPS